VSDLPEGWVETSIREMIALVIDNRGRNPKSYSLKGIPVIDNYLIVGERKINLLNIKRYINDNTYSTFIRKHIQKNDVLMTLVGNGYGNVALAPKEKSVIIQNTVGLRCNSLNDSLFLFYNLCYQKNVIKKLDIGAAQPSIKVGNLLDVVLRVPKLPEQKAIANILTALDKKIALLQAQNQTLETLAQTIFKQWFVENTVLDGESKSIVKLGMFAENITNSVKPIDFSTEVKYIGLEHIERKNIGLSKNGTGSNVKSNKYKFSEGDILFGKLRPYFHKVCFAPYDGICSTDILVIRPKKQQYFGLCLFAFNQKEVVEYAKRGSEGTRMPRTNWKMLSQYLIKLPNDTTIKKFNSFVVPLIQKIKLNLSEVETLTKTRNTLLPKLMSGKTVVKSEKEAEA